MSYTSFDFPHTHMYESDLREILAQLKNLSKDVKALDEWKVTHEAEYHQLKELYDEVMSGNFPQSIKDGFTAWMEENAIDLVGDLVKMVFFEITEEGYFVAYIPESWDDITFNTVGLDITIPDRDYGTLVLSY